MSLYSFAVCGLCLLFGQIAMANKVLVPATTAVKFPTLEVSYSDGKIIKLPVGLDGNAGDASKLDLPKATLLCLSFRASSQVWGSYVDALVLIVPMLCVFEIVILLRFVVMLVEISQRSGSF